MSLKRESDFQASVKREIEDRFVGCLVMKLDSGQLQGIPDLIILYKNKWATLECKRSAHAPRRPNQEYYVGMMNGMSFSRFIFPENRAEVLNELQQAFEA